MPDILTLMADAMGDGPAYIISRSGRKEAMRAALRALNDAGYRVVPVEPTEAQSKGAGYDDPFWDYRDDFRGKGEVDGIYRAMLQAAPAIEGGE